MNNKWIGKLEGRRRTQTHAGFLGMYGKHWLQVRALRLSNKLPIFSMPKVGALHIFWAWPDARTEIQRENIIFCIAQRGRNFCAHPFHYIAFLAVFTAN